MLVLTRKAREEIVIGEGANQVLIGVQRIEGNRVRLYILAPKEMRIRRSELPPKKVDPSCQDDRIIA